MSNRPQFIPTICPPPPPGSPGSPPDDAPPPEETFGYVLDIRNDLHSGDPERQDDGLRRLLILGLENGQLDFLDTGEIARMQVELGFIGALVEGMLCLICSEHWPPEMMAAETLDPLDLVN